MAYRTDEQRNVIHELISEYGVPDRCMIEKTNKPYGLVWLRWHHAAEKMPQDRNLFVKPDGTRLTWILEY